MTREEAISLIKSAQLMLINPTTNEPVSDLYAAFEMAIKALEQEPCEDAISREDAIKCVESHEYTMKAAAELRTLPSVTPSRQWIPVSERLPEAEYGESDSVLVCFENETQDVLYFDGSNWRYPTGEIYISVNHKNGWHNKVKAWMPKPEPYKAEMESEK